MKLDEYLKMKEGVPEFEIVLPIELSDEDIPKVLDAIHDYWQYLQHPMIKPMATTAEQMKEAQLYEDYFRRPLESEEQEIW